MSSRSANRFSNPWPKPPHKAHCQHTNPNTTGTAIFTISVTDADGDTVTKEVSFKVDPATGPVVPGGTALVVDESSMPKGVGQVDAGVSDTMALDGTLLGGSSKPRRKSSSSTANRS